ncbi:S41 family peptidase [Brevundimonas variabilis]|uniref:Tail specific protease domain-containing protein n=1 Tax=Brevundimonas variabilis TaxID=74312 RepID=A0A7W9FEN3_9CAUL|nr:S41 family peptidase [Brevundimonas variabilis]MBB5744524.1 hypothetical protein [Brevundimonas variabilis]
MTLLHRRQLCQLSAAFVASAAIPGSALARTDDNLVSDDWSDDVAILRSAWQTLHPGLYRYSTPDQITARLDDLALAWTAPATFRQRFLALSRVTASVQCGHTYPNPYNARAVVRDRLYPDRALVPFRFRWIDSAMVVTHDDEGQGRFAPGTIITAIDGVPTSELLARLIPLARADGTSIGKRISLMEVRGEDRYETFDIHLPLVLPVRDSARFTLADGTVVAAPLFTLTQRQAGLPASASTAPDANPWTLATGDDGIARLTMPTWGLYNSTFDWKAWLAGVMDALASSQSRGLIVDLRGNEGGADCGDIILSRLLVRDLALPRDPSWVRYRKAPEALLPHLDTWDRSFFDWGDQAVASDERPGFFRLVRDGDGASDTVIRAEGQRFAGPVAVICDASTSSATFAFCRTVKDNGLATLIGQTTGGNRRGINGGAFAFLRLPTSGIEVDLPLIAGFPLTPQPDAAILPDLAVSTTARDIARGLDPQMAAATAHILSR